MFLRSTPLDNLETKSLQQIIKFSSENFCNNFFEKSGTVYGLLKTSHILDIPGKTYLYH